MADKSLRASVTVVDLGATTTRVVPVAEIDYVLLASSAYMDTSGHFQFKGEVLLALDSSQYAYSKPLNETVPAIDVASLTSYRSVAEGLTATDSLVRGVTQSKTETLTANDSKAIGFTPATVVEPLSAVDSSALGIAAAKTDSVAIADSAYVLLVYIRDVFDTVAPTDVAALSVATIKTDAAFPTDSSAFTFIQQLTDAFGMNDLADIGDGIAFQFDDYTNNVVTPSDTVNLTPRPVYSDTISVSDTGVGSVQDYCDITYFAEDYVGSRFTF